MDIPVADLEDIQQSVSTSGNIFKISKTSMKFEYQVLTDIVSKGILAKTGSFAIVTLEKFQVLTAILKGIKVNWASFLFNILKNMFQASKQSKGFAVQLCHIFTDSGLLDEGDLVSHKYKIFSASSISSQYNRW